MRSTLELQLSGLDRTQVAGGGRWGGRQVWSNAGGQGKVQTEPCGHQDSGQHGEWGRAWQDMSV